jgi:hypothetical protein
LADGYPVPLPVPIIPPTLTVESQITLADIAAALAIFTALVDGPEYDRTRQWHCRNR